MRPTASTMTAVRAETPTVDVDHWDHVTVTQGIDRPTHRLRDLAVALVAALCVAAVAAWIGAAVVTSPASADATATASAPASHARLGTVVHSNPHAHPRLGPVVHHSPTTGSTTGTDSAPITKATTTTDHSRLGTVTHHGALPRQWKS